MERKKSNYLCMMLLSTLKSKRINWKTVVTNVRDKLHCQAQDQYMKNTNIFIYQQ